MSEEKTQDIPDPRSFEERVFARFDALDARLDGIDRRLDGLDGRVQRLEEESERRAVETKPIWERALAGILAVQQRLDKVEGALKDFSRKFSILNKEMLQLRSDQLNLEERVERLGPESTR